MSQDHLSAGYLAILHEPQFTRADVLTVTGVSDGQLKGILDRQQVVLSGEHNPGSGRRRMFSGADILSIAVANGMSGIGFPMRWAYLVAEDVVTRASHRLSGFVDHTPGLHIAMWPQGEDDWARVPIHEGMDELPPGLPPFMQVLHIDRLIDQVLAKLQALIEDKPLPNFDVTIPAADPDFARRWTKDAQDRKTLVGLTFEETQEFENVREKVNRDEGSVATMKRNRDRYLELHGKHEDARLAQFEKDADRPLGEILADALKKRREKE
jgi:hypothetical protein